MDTADHASDHEEKELKNSLKFYSNVTCHRSGPLICNKCGEENDRSQQGYCVCSECMKAS